MTFNSLPSGKQLPNDIYVVIEISANSQPVKYEIDKDLGAIMVDRFMTAPMFYPANYGYIPQTLADDGDPIDVLVVTPYPVAPGSIVRSRPVGVLKMSDEKGEDVKILAVPHQKLSKLYDHVNEYTDLPSMLIEQIEHFFSHYKKLEAGKWVNVEHWGSNSDAHTLIESAALNYNNTL